MIDRFQGMAMRIGQEMPHINPKPHARELAIMTGRLLRQSEDHLGREVTPSSLNSQVSQPLLCTSTSSSSTSGL
jgi:hypothetical protein